MVVEDDGLLRWSLQHALGDAGWRVIAAPDPCTALGALPESLDLLILGLKRRDHDGRILLRPLHRRSPDCRVIVTTPLLREDECEARKLGACRVIKKPIDLNRMAGQVRDLLRRDPIDVR